MHRVGDIVEPLSSGDRQYRDFSIWDGEEFLLVQHGRFWKKDSNPLPEPIFSPEGEMLADNLPAMRSKTDATLLRGDASEEEVSAWAERMSDLNPRNVCVFPAHIEAVRKWFPSPATVISFPHGASTTEGKLAEIKAAAGAGEIDVVAPLRLIGRDWKGFCKEIALLQRESAAPLKVILETALWSKADIKEATRILKEEGVFSAKTSTGTIEGASEEAIAAMRSGGGDIEIKASGGVRDRLIAGRMQRAGATIFGASNLEDWR